MRFIQARNPKWVGRLFFANYNPYASWIDDLEPAFSKEFFYKQKLSRYLAPYSEHKMQFLEHSDLELEEIVTET